MSRIEKLSVVTTMGVAVAMLVVIVPYVVSGFYLHRGTDMLQRAMMEQGLHSGEWSELVGQPIGPLGDRVKSQLDAAERFLDWSVRWDSKNLEAYRGLAKIYQIRHDNPADLEVLVRAGDLHPDNPMLHLVLGDIYDGLGWAEKAIAEYEQGGYGPSMERAIANYLKLADWRLKAGDPNSALPLLRQVITLDPGNLYALYHFAKICETLGEGERLLAEEIYRQIRYFPLESIQPRQDTRLDEFTAEVIPNLVDENTWSLDGALNVVSFWIWQGDVTATERALEHLLERYPVEPDLYYYLAQVFQLQARLVETVNAAGKAIELEPEYAPAYLEIARAYEEQGKLSEAVDWYEVYHELVPEDLLSLVRLTEIHHRLGNVDEASRWQGMLQARTDDRRIVAELLGVPVEAVELGENLVENGGFEIWKEGNPEGWTWSNMATGNPWNLALFAGRFDEFEAYESHRAMRVDGFWIQRKPELEPARAGYWSEGITLEPSTPYLLTFYYKTTGMSEEQAAVWLSSDQLVFFTGDHALPKTGGGWRKYTIVGCNRAGRAQEIRPLLRHWGIGSVWFDRVEVRQILLPKQRDVCDLGPRFLLR